MIIKESTKKKSFAMSLALLAVSMSMLLGCPSNNNSNNNDGGVTDTTAPTLSSSVPANGATGVSIDANIVLSYSEAVKVATGNITLTPTGGTALTIAVTDAQVSVSGAVVTINPSADLIPDTQYTLLIPAAAIQDLADNPAAMTPLTFTTTATADGAPPQISSTVPANGATGVSIDANIVLNYSKAVKVATGNITLTPMGGTALTIAVTDAQVSVSGAVLTINPSADLMPGTRYTLSIPAAAIQDLADNPAAMTPLTFTTAPDTTPPTLESSIPAPSAANFPINSAIVLNYSEAVEVGTGSITLTPMGGTALTITVTVSGAVVTINPSANLMINTQHTLAIPAAAIQDLADNPAAMTSLTFTTIAADNTAPVLSSTVPFADATDVPIGTDIVLNYSEAVKVGTGNITLTPMGGGTALTIAVTDTTQVSVAGAVVVTIDPSADLMPSTKYTLNILSGTIQDLAGNNAAVTAYFFTTVDVTRNIVLWVGREDFTSAQVGNALRFPIATPLCPNAAKPAVATGAITRPFLVTTASLSDHLNPTGFTVDNMSSGTLLSAYTGTNPVYAANSATTTLTNSDKVAESYADFISPTTDLLRTLNQAGLNEEGERSSDEPNRFWTGMTNSESAGGYVPDATCESGGKIWQDVTTVTGVGEGHSVAKLPRMGNTARDDVLSTGAGCDGMFNVVCITY